MYQIIQAGAEGFAQFQCGNQFYIGTAADLPLGDGPFGDAKLIRELLLR